MLRMTKVVPDASHELRTPIAVIQGYANMLDRWGKTDEKILDESISAIRNEADHMSYLVEQLLFLARGDSGKTSLNRQNVQTGDLMQEIYEESLMIDEEHRYRLFGGESAEVSIDAGLMK
ncbi:MAG: histidine kinase dimerization/phospho-acceptor domain-containing protein [Lachnospiraceae bacterium]|nr:histidine kinase dimerization/phospho-acceptor domain-containing protein [Lachnospiraceae bacterium]